MVYFDRRFLYVKIYKRKYLDPNPFDLTQEFHLNPNIYYHTRDLTSIQLKIPVFTVSSHLIQTNRKEHHDSIANIKIKKAKRQNKKKNNNNKTNFWLIK